MIRPAPVVTAELTRRLAATIDPDQPPALTGAHRFLADAEMLDRLLESSGLDASTCGGLLLFRGQALLAVGARDEALDAFADVVPDRREPADERSAREALEPAGGQNLHGARLARRRQRELRTTHAKAHEEPARQIARDC